MRVTIKFILTLQRFWKRKARESLLHLSSTEAPAEVEAKITLFYYLNLERNVLNVHVKRKHFDLFLDTDIGKIQVEINSYYSDYIPVRNTSYICNTYTSYTARCYKYNPNINIIQINFSYGLKKDKLFSRYYIQDEDGNKYASNFLIIELNMDKYMEFWYNKDEEEINKYIEYIMLDLGEKGNMMIENSIRLERD